MRYSLCEQAAHVLVTENARIYPMAVSFSRRDSCYEIEKVGGGIDLRTNGTKGLEIEAEGEFSPDERYMLERLISSFVSGRQSVTVDGVQYGPMILLEGSLTENVGESGGRYRLVLIHNS
ncbi:hypothetical protein [Ruminococcus sp.]|uniref:hypothetical protein n=1 Tax=Ruminococcus sp. TaxID=41978 RepID=UPI0025D1FAB2|nr:hypothetical protein [Ruminococcus sp.]MBQ8965938.1 hypothetical protein [Ruminococcus sp.]